MNKVLIWICCVVSICFFACKAKKAAPVIVKQNIDSTVKVPNAEDLLGSTLKDWRYFSARIDVEYRNGKDKQNVDASIHMLKDSLVWISAGLIGYEGVRVLISNDSMGVINKLNKTYTVYKSEAIAGFSDVPLTVRQIQNLIIGKPAYALMLYKILANTDANIHIVYTQEKFITSHFYKKEFYTIDSTTINDRTTSNYAKAIYKDYASVNGHNFPYTSHITASNGNQLIQIEMKYKHVDFESPVSFSFNIPPSYERINK